MRFRAVLVALIGLALLAPDANAVGSNMLKNFDFEKGINKNTFQGIDQPLLPEDWAFEGSAALFDHTPHHRRSGRYSAAISIPASGKPRFCYDQPVGCHTLTPVNDAKKQAATAYSVAPAWRPAVPVKLTSARLYQVTGWYRWELASIDEGGAVVRVRWLDANLVPIRTDLAWSRIARTQSESNGVGWTSFAATLTAPANAAHAIPLFGAADDVFITNISYDDVSFHTA